MATDSNLQEAREAILRVRAKLGNEIGTPTIQSYTEFLTRNVPQTIKSIFDMEEGNRRLVVDDISLHVPEDINDYDKVSEIKDNGADLSVPLKGRFTLYEDGQVKEQSRPRLIARVPFPTREGNFVLGGTEYTIRRQLRLSPGVYVSKTRDKQTHAMLNTATKQSANIYLDPNSSKFTFKIGNKQFPLDVVMDVMGVPEENLAKSWGQRIYEANHTPPHRRRAIRERLYGAMFQGSKPENNEEAVKAIRDQFKESTFDPWVTKTTLGKSMDFISPELLTRTTEKMLGVAAGKVKPDNREAMHFKVPFDIGMAVNHALVKATPKIQNKLKFRLRDRENIDSIVNTPLQNVSSTMNAKFNQDELSHTADQYNPFGMFTDSTEITLMGEGGLRSTHQITNEARDIDDSATGMIDNLHTPEGQHLGVNMHLSNRARIYGDKLLMMGLVDAEGKVGSATPREYYDKVVALPGQIKFKDGLPVLSRETVNVLHKGELQEMPASKVNLIMGGNVGMNLGATSFIPFAGYNAGNRLSVRQMGQAVPLSDPDEPFVQAYSSSGKPIGKDFYDMMNPQSHAKGTVTRVGQTAITVMDDKGEKHRIPIRHDYQLNGNASITDRPLVRAGDTVSPGQVVAENNYSKKGNLALGKNLDVAYIPYHGYNHQDGLVVSESAAQKMTSQHSYRHDFSNGRGDVYDIKKYMAHYPNRYKKEQLANLDENGLPKVGATIMPGDPITLKLTEQELSEDDILRGNISRAFKKPMRDDAKIWDGDVPAVVKKVVKGKDGYQVILGTTESMQVGDKMSGYYGQRGVITKIVPDEEMPKYEDGTIPDVLQNPAAVPSRMNAGQIMETMASRIARKTGQPYMMDNFGDFPNSKTLRQEMFKHGIGEEKEDGDIDVERKLTFPDGSAVDAKVMAGSQYFFKLKQTADKYYGARGRKDPYDIISHKPIGGSKMDPLGLYAMLAHGATHNLKEIGNIKSEKNDDFWRALETGQPLPIPQTTFAMDKLMKLMNGAGINVKEDGKKFTLLPMTDADVTRMSSGEVEDPTMAVRITKSKGKPVEAYKGGLFDQKLFGGLEGDKYGHITLASPIPNPIFEKPVRDLLGLKDKEYSGLISGDYGVNEENQIIQLEGNQQAESLKVYKRGDAFNRLLSQIDVDSSIEQLKNEFKTARGDDRNQTSRKLAYLGALKKHGLKPTDYMLSKVPVIPPKFRPVYLTKNNDLRVSDITEMYKKIGLQNDAAKRAAGLPEAVQRDNFKNLYDTVKGLQNDGYTEPYSKKHTAGILEYLKGTNPKSGHFMSNILSKRESIGGHATIMPDPRLPIDQAKIPEDMAWKDFEPFVMRRLARAGVRPLDAEKMVEERHEMARKALESELKERPFILTRDPKLHKHNALAFMATTHPGKSIIIPSLVCKGFNADFDGDRMIAHVPVTDAAVQEARNKMMPSQNLFKPGPDTIIAQPQEESIAGLFAATRVGRKLNLTFKTTQEITKAYEDGTLKINDGVKLNSTETTPGRIMANQDLPAQVRDYSMVFSADNVQKLSQQLAEFYPTQASKYIQSMKNTGDEFATKMALSFKSSDFDPVEDKEEIQAMLARNNGKGLTEKERENLSKKLRKHVGDDSIIAILADSGAKGKWSNTQQLLYSPIKTRLVTGGEDKHVIRHGYAEGMTYRDFISAAHGSRKGMLDKGVETARPGEFSKQLLRNSYGMLVQKGDSSEVEGMTYPINHRTVLNRYLAEDVKAGNGRVLAKVGQPVSSDLVARARKAGIKNFSVRSPLTSNAPDGIYAKDFGRLPGNQKPAPGTDLGIISAHTLTEQSTQGVLKKFHSAGAVETTKSMGFEPVWKLLMGKAPSGEVAAMAPRGGKIQAIKKLPDGTHEVNIGGKVFKASAMPFKYKVGEEVKAGAQLQDGYPEPKDVLKYKGHRALQTYLVDEIERNFGDGAPDRRYIEGVVANLTRYAEVEDPGDSDYTQGSYVNANALSKFNADQIKNKKAFQPVKYKPVFVGIGPSSHKTTSDWASSLIHGHMAQQLPQMAASGAESAKTGTDPIMPYLHSTTFGDEIGEGRY